MADFGKTGCRKSWLRKDVVRAMFQKNRNEKGIDLANLIVCGEKDLRVRTKVLQSNSQHLLLRSSVSNLFSQPQ